MDFVREEVGKIPVGILGNVFINKNILLKINHKKLKLSIRI